LVLRVKKTVKEFGGRDILFNNAAFQVRYRTLVAAWSCRSTSVELLVETEWGTSIGLGYDAFDS